MHELPLSTDGHGFTSGGWLFEPTKIFCEPFDSARILRLVKNKHVQLIQKGYFEGNDWYKINLHDSNQTTGYVKGERVSFLGNRTNPCNNHNCRYLYYSYEPHRIDKYVVNRKVILRTINPLDSTCRNFLLTEESRRPDVHIQHLKQVEKSDFYCVKVEYENSFGVRGTCFLLLVNRVDGNISLLHKEAYLGTEDGLKQVNIYYPNGRKYMDYLKFPLDDFPPDTIARPNVLHSYNVVLITTHSESPVVDKSGMTLLDKNGLVRFQETGNTKKWYDIVDGKFVPKKMERK